MPPDQQSQPASKEPAAKQPTLKSHTIWFMIAVALFYDGAQALLDLIGIGWLLVPLAYLHFWLWFRLHGIKFFSVKRSAVIGTGALLEFLTAGILPGTTFTVARIALDYKIKKAVGI